LRKIDGLPKKVATELQGAEPFGGFLFRILGSYSLMRSVSIG
jgi:hypothetical protein